MEFNAIIRKYLKWHSLDLKGYQLWSKRIKFIHKDNCWQETSLGLEGFPKPKEKDSLTVKITRYPLILLIFGIDISPNCYIADGI